MTHFAHRRFLNEDGSIDPRGGITIAYKQYKDSIQYAIARCHERDNFNKQQGRIKAAGRLNSDKSRHNTTESLQAFKERIYTTPLTSVGFF